MPDSDLSLIRKIVENESPPDPATREGMYFHWLGRLLELYDFQATAIRTITAQSALLDAENEVLRSSFKRSLMEEMNEKRVEELGISDDSTRRLFEIAATIQRDVRRSLDELKEWMEGWE